VLDVLSIIAKLQSVSEESEGIESFLYGLEDITKKDGELGEILIGWLKGVEAEGIRQFAEDIMPRLNELDSSNMEKLKLVLHKIEGEDFEKYLDRIWEVMRYVEHFSVDRDLGVEFTTWKSSDSTTIHILVGSTQPLGHLTDIKGALDP